MKKSKILLPKGHPDRAKPMTREDWNLRKMRPSELRPWPGNPRDNDDSVDGVAESIRTRGFLAPIVGWPDAKGDVMVVAGHVRLKAARKLGLKTVPVLLATGLTRAQAESYALSDNKTAEASTWNLEMLQDVLRGKEEITAILSGFMNTRPRKDKSDSPSVLASLEKKVNCPKCGHKFAV